MGLLDVSLSDRLAIMQIIFKDEKIENLRQLLKDEYKEEFSTEEARQIANNVLEYFEIISELDETQIDPEYSKDQMGQSV